MTACRVCAIEFDKDRMGQIVCGIECAKRMPTVNRRAEREAKREHRQKVDAAKPRSHWLKTAQSAFNGWIRARDASVGCISCGTFSGKMNACHYRSVGSSPELRFEPLNVHRGCERCNSYLHGNLIPYRVELANRIGAEKVAWLEGPHEPKHYTTDELKAIGIKYRAMTRELKA
jgi:hypothetical protein